MRLVYLVTSIDINKFLLKKKHGRRHVAFAQFLGFLVVEKMWHATIFKRVKLHFKNDLHLL